MVVEEENVSKILAALSHPLRRQILLHLSEMQECSFTDFSSSFGVDTGKLSFHLRTLEAFLEQTPGGKYRLSRVGENAIALMKDLETWAADANARGKFTRPLAGWKGRTAAFLLDVGIGLLLFVGLPNVLYPITLEFASLNINVIFFLLIFWAYLTLLEGFAGQSLGKLLMNLKVVRTNGKDLSYDHAAVRNFGKVFLLPIDLALGVRLKDRRFIRYFDKFSGTTVIDLRPQAFQPPADQASEEATAESVSVVPREVN